MAFVLHAAFFGVGTTGCVTGWKLHHCRRKASVSAHAEGADGDAAVADPVRGSGAPWRIHSAKFAMMRASSFAPFFGILSDGCVCRSAWSNRLESGWPGTSAGPDSPPLSNPSRVSSARPPFFFAVAWHS